VALPSDPRAQIKYNNEGTADTARYVHRAETVRLALKATINSSQFLRGQAAWGSKR
jgi:hypothetical protein